MDAPPDYDRHRQMTAALVRGRAAVVGAALLCIVIAIGPSVSGAAPGPKPAAIKALKKKAVKKTRKAVHRELPGVGIPELASPNSPPTIKVTSCKQRKKHHRFAGFTCSWNAHGEAPGLVPFRCNGKAIFDAKRKKVKRIDRCANRDEAQVPLLASPHELAFGYFETFDVFGDLFDELHNGGAVIARQDLDWPTLEPTPSPPASWNWSTYDALYSQFLAAGIRPVWTLLPAPCWAAANRSCAPGATNPISPAHISDYAAVAAQVAARYPASAGIEVWLEPNSARFWGATPDPQTFSDLVGATVSAVAATQTGVPVISGGLAPGAAASDKVEAGKFLAQALARGGIKSAAAIGLDAVPDVPFKSGSDPTAGYLGRIRILIQTLETAEAAAGASAPIGITELAFSTPGYSEAQQAEALVSSYQMLRRVAGIPFVIVSKLLDTGDGTKVQGFGVLHSNRSPKPAYCQLATARGVPKPPGC